jgi:hypothetical protein
MGWPLTLLASSRLDFKFLPGTTIAYLVGVSTMKGEQVLYDGQQDCLLSLRPFRNPR